MSKERGVAVAATMLLCSHGCGRDELSDWMLGVYSSAPPGFSNSNEIQHYTASEDGTFLILYPVTNGRISQTWRRAGSNEILIFPGPDDAQQDFTWSLRRTRDCDVVEYQMHVDGEPFWSQPVQLYRGEICVDRIDTQDGCGDAIECEGTYLRRWCDAAPEPCDDDPLEAPTTDGGG